MENKHHVHPFCYLEEPILNLIHKEYAEAVSEEWRAFELRPDPVPTLGPQEQVP